MSAPQKIQASGGASTFIAQVQPRSSPGLASFANTFQEILSRDTPPREEAKPVERDEPRPRKTPPEQPTEPNALFALAPWQLPMDLPQVGPAPAQPPGCDATDPDANAETAAQDLELAGTTGEILAGPLAETLRPSEDRQRPVNQLIPKIEAPPKEPAHPAGTDAAKPDLAMTKALKLNEITSLTEQKLPEMVEVASPSLQLEEEPKSFDSTPDPVALGWNTAPSPVHSEPNGLYEVQRVHAPVEIQFTNSVLEQSALLKSVRADSMAVVLRPDDRTEIFLQLSRKDGEIHAHARFERGDFDQLNQHWGVLTGTLAEQGIQLAPLESANSSTGFSNHFAQQREPRSPQAQPDPRPLRTTASNSPSVPEPVSPTTISPHLLESWA